MAANVQAVLSALEVFSSAQDKTSLENANTWLQDFQHSSDAWATCNILLQSPDTLPAAKLFAAQTFRAKVTYDLHQIDGSNVLALRDTLVSALQTFRAGPRTLLVQLCLALSGLALQTPAWENPVQDMIDSFGRNPASVPALLQFLTVLPEELTGNTRIPVTDDEYREREYKILTSNADKVVDLLAMYLQASGVTLAVQSQVFNCLSSWLSSGELTAESVARTPLLQFAFEALASEDLFDSAVSVVCDLIHETQEVEDNMPVIERIVPQVIALKPQLAEFHDDPEKVRGLARIFAEAGEAYRSLLLHHTESFYPIVEAIRECASYPDLDIVPITFPFWMRLAQSIGKKASVSPLLLDEYKALVGVVINHLHFPPDLTTVTGQEAENFRSFRHVMGDTLKDCCFVLGADACLTAVYDMITSAMARGTYTWQEVEAPLFSMRSMGAEVNPTDDLVVPKIMDLISTLPPHPRIRYASLLIISRYTEWINKHPAYIPYMLQYISAGFEDSDMEVVAAAGQALKYLCQDCKGHLVEYLPQLHTFLKAVGSKVAQEDKATMYEAIAFVISAMPMERASQTLREFSLEILAVIHAAATKPTPASKEELKVAIDGLENLEVMLGVVDTFGTDLPPACRNSCHEAWVFFDPFIAKYGSDSATCERVTRVLRFALRFFGTTALPVMPSVLARMSASFETTGFASYLWIIGKVVSQFGHEDDPALQNAFKQAYEHSSTKLYKMLQETSPAQIPDVIEDYLRMLTELIDYSPDVFFHSPAFPIAFHAAMAGLNLVQADIVFAALDVIRDVVSHECLDPVSSTPKSVAYASSIKDVVQKDGLELTGLLLTGLTGEFPEDTVSSVIAIFRGLVGSWSTLFLSWLPVVLQQLPSVTVPATAKTKFLADITQCVNGGQYDKVKYAVLTLNRECRKARERRRGGALEN